MCYPLRKTNPHQRVRSRKRKGGTDIETGGEFSCDRKCKQSSGDWQGQYTVSASGWLSYLANTRLDSSKTHHTAKLSLLYATQVFATSDFTTDFCFNRAGQFSAIELHSTGNMSNPLHPHLCGN